ncbi:hypothetical protein VTN96DRAFT_316 [Rasamsonia emersonii]
MFRFRCRKYEANGGMKRTCMEPFSPAGDDCRVQNSPPLTSDGGEESRGRCQRAEAHFACIAVGMLISFAANERAASSIASRAA